jgi:hypothetical protein
LIHTTLRTVGWCAIAAMLAGCGQGGGQDNVVATAGDDIRVTLADFNEAYNRISAASRPDISTLELKRNFANDLVNKELLLHEAERMGGPITSICGKFVNIFTKPSLAKRESSTTIAFIVLFL